ncbi:MAG: hypothetical protein II889_09120 [Clostridia bacterium]|nr:hypothetical protein [Clostridia bacterium]
MTVQLPVVLWTVICFCLLIVILNRLLFRPMLAFMDAREEKIRRGREKRDADAEAVKTAEEALETFRREEEAHLDALARETVAEARREADEMTARAAREAAEAVEGCRVQLEEDAKEIAQQLDKRTEELARAYLSALTGV